MGDLQVLLAEPPTAARRFGSLGVVGTRVLLMERTLAMPGETGAVWGNRAVSGVMSLPGVLGTTSGLGVETPAMDAPAGPGDEEVATLVDEDMLVVLPVVDLLSTPGRCVRAPEPIPPPTVQRGVIGSFPRSGRRGSRAERGARSSVRRSGDWGPLTAGRTAAARG